uniref:Uncharacterized protein n=1 Tax=Anguilla anguilla TaxID=7936 RepID=A0A0E9SFR5_ANGAN
MSTSKLTLLCDFYLTLLNYLASTCW